jgi:hypothetical protein
MKIEEAVNEEVAIAFGTLTDLGIPQEIRENEGKQFL